MGERERRGEADSEGKKRNRESERARDLEQTG
jgi:hypothetical protein